MSVMLVMLLSACKGGRAIKYDPLGNWDGSLNGLEDLIAEKQMEASFFRFEANAILIDGDQQLEFKLEMRLRKDTVVWLNITDPILGIPLARAVVYPDSALMINRLERTYFRGDERAIRDLIGAEVAFAELQAMVTASFPVLSELDSVKALSERTLALYPNRIDLKTSGQLNDPLLHSPGWHASSYSIVTQPKNERILLRFDDYASFNSIEFPSAIRLSVPGSTRRELQLSIREADHEFRPTPFRIPTSYVPMP